MVAQTRATAARPENFFFPLATSSKIAPFRSHLLFCKENLDDNLAPDCHFDRNSAAGILADARLPTHCRTARRSAHKINVGLQLYSLRAQLAKDVPGTLATGAEKWGITDVEAAGFYNLSAEQFRARTRQAPA